MKKILQISLLLLSSYFVQAQAKSFTMDDAMLKARTTFAAQNLSQLQFYGNTNEYVYLKDGNWLKGAAGVEPSIFLTLNDLNRKLEKAGLDTVKVMPAIKFQQGGWIMIVNGNKISLDPVIRSYKTLVPKELAAKENVEESAAGFIAYLDNYNLHVSYFPRKELGSLKVADEEVTTDGSKDIVYASSVHREEFGISKGIFWSNSGNKLAFYRMDQSMVTDYPLIDWTQKPAKAELIKYPMAGDKSHHVTVGVYNAVEKKTIWLKTGEPAEQYLTNIAWSPDDRFIYIAIVNRAQNHMWLNQYDASTGNFIKTLFEETDEKYIEPLMPMQFLKNNATKFLWQSNRDGWNHIYLYDTSGKLMKQLTKGNWEVIDVKGFDEKGENLFYVSTALSPVNKNLYRLNMKTGVTTSITPEPGVHYTQVSIDGSLVLDSYSDLTTPRIIQLVNTKKPNASAEIILHADNPLRGYTKSDLSIFTIGNKHGDSIFCRLYKPVFHDPGEKHPVIVYWYGGPHAQMILNSWNGGSGDYWFQYMAQRGYVVFTIDTRGSDNRGKAFEQSIFRKLGDAQMEDMMAAVDYLTRQPYVDTTRMGLFGWSFGGFLTTDFMLNHPGIFKAAVAGGPVMNWQYYEIMYGERYMDTPQENPEGYAATDLTKQVGKLKGKLLLIHGLQDPVVVQQNSISFVKACVDQGIQIDYMLYPGHEHNVIGKDRAHLYQKVTDYFKQHLK